MTDPQPPEASTSIVSIMILDAPQEGRERGAVVLTARWPTAVIAHQLAVSLLVNEAVWQHPGQLAAAISPWFPGGRLVQITTTPPVGSTYVVTLDLERQELGDGISTIDLWAFAKTYSGVFAPVPPLDPLLPAQLASEDAPAELPSGADIVRAVEEGLGLRAAGSAIAAEPLDVDPFVVARAVLQERIGEPLTPPIALRGIPAQLLTEGVLWQIGPVVNFITPAGTWTQLVTTTGVLRERGRFPNWPD